MGGRAARGPQPLTLPSAAAAGTLTFVSTTELPFRFTRTYRVAGLPFGVTPGRCLVRVTDDELLARFGPWTVRTPLANVTGTDVTGPYRFPLTAGPAHLSVSDRGLTFATNGIANKDVVDWTDLGKEMWSYLTGKGAAIDYTFVDMTVEVPRDTGPSAPRAIWKLDGTLRITTTDRDNAGASSA